MGGKVQRWSESPQFVETSTHMERCTCMYEGKHTRGKMHLDGWRQVHTWKDAPRWVEASTQVEECISVGKCKCREGRRHLTAWRQVHRWTGARIGRSIYMQNYLWIQHASFCLQISSHNFLSTLLKIDK